MPDTNSPLLSYLLDNEPAFRRARLAALYSDFRHLQATNPDGYAANVEAWCEGLAHASRAGVLPSSDLLSININEELLRDLESKQWGRPLALGTAVHESIRRRDFIPAKEFQDSKESIYHNPWSLNPLNLLGWGLRQLGVSAGFGTTVATGQFVVLQNLEEAGRELIKRTERRRGRAARTFSRKQFDDEFRDVLPARDLSDRDMEVLLRFLQRDKGFLIYDSQTVKLVTPGETASITHEDSTIASLKNLIQDLEHQTTVLEEKLDRFAATAREAVSRKNKVSALAALRSKKLTESTLSKRHATLSQLEEMFLKIEQASDQVELVRVMESSAQVLGRLNKEVGDVERVDEVVDDLREQMSRVDEVGNIIAEIGQGDALDEGEVDDELERMEIEERKKGEEREMEERAEKTRRELAELEETQRKATEEAVRAKEKEARREPSREEGLEESIERMKKMSLDSSEHATA